MALAGYTATVSITGDSTAFSNTVLTEVTEGFVYQMPSAAQRILNPAVAVTVQVDADGAGAGAYASVTDETAYRIDYLNGTVTFATQLAAAATVRLSGAYLATLPVAEARNVSFDRTRDELDITVFGNTDKRFMAGMKQAEGDIETLALLSDDLDSGASVVSMQALFEAGTPKLLQVTLGNSTFRAWVRLFGLSSTSSPSELVVNNITWKATAIQGTGQSEYAVFGMY